MTDEEVERALLTAACRRAKPYLNHEVPYPSGSTADGNIKQTLWELGYRHVRAEVIAMGALENQVDRALAKAKMTTEGLDPDDLVSLPVDLEDDLYEAFLEEGDEDSGDENTLEVIVYSIDERLVGGVDDFRVEMFSNESIHAGRPHVKVHLADGAISVSLDDPPDRIAGPKGELRKERAAIKAVARHRQRLLDLWYTTRPDDQKLKSQAAEYLARQPPQQPAPPAPPVPPPRRSK